MSVRVPAALVRLCARPVSRRVHDPRLPWDVQRRRLDRITGAWPLPRGTSVTRTTCGGVPAEIVTADRARPRSGGGTATVVHFHGGGYCVGSPAEARSWAARLSARTGCRVVLPEYRLAPEHPYPAAAEDARSVVNVTLSGAAPGTVVVSGDSAGGGLALGAVLTAPGALPGPAGCILLSPWLDLTMDRTAAPDLARRDVILTPAWLEACARAYTGTADRAHPLISPLRSGLDGLPPLLIQCGTDDLVAPDARTLATRAAAARVDVTCTRWPGMWHGFQFQTGLTTAADRALAQAAAFIARACAPGGG